MAKPVYLWDYAIDESTFREILSGEKILGRLDRKWALLRLLEYAPYAEIRRRMSFQELVQEWPQLRRRIRSEGRRRGLDFLVQWLQQQHPELL